MFVRFVVETIDADSGRRQGLFQAATALRESHALSNQDHDRLEVLRAWFNMHLTRPERLSLSPRPHSKAQALSWFKDTATEHISKMREMQNILERYGLSVKVVKARRLGYVLCEDEYQVAAYPFADTPT